MSIKLPAFRHYTYWNFNFHGLWFDAVIVVLVIMAVADDEDSTSVGLDPTVASALEVLLFVSGGGGGSFLNRSDSYVAAVFHGIAGCLPSRFAPECLHGIVTLLRAESHDRAALVEGNRPVLAPVVHGPDTDLVPRGHLVACLQ